MRKILLPLALILALAGCAHEDRYVTVEFDGTTYACHLVSSDTCKVALEGGMYRTVHFDPSKVR